MLNEWLNDLAQEEHEKTASSQFEEVLQDMDIPELRAFMKMAEGEVRAPTTYERLMTPEGTMGGAIPLDPDERKAAYLENSRWTVPAQAVTGGAMGGMLGAFSGPGGTTQLSGKRALVGAGIGALAGTGLQMGARHLAAGGIRNRAEDEAAVRASQAKTASIAQRLGGAARGAIGGGLIGAGAGGALGAVSGATTGDTMAGLRRGAAIGGLTGMAGGGLMGAATGPASSRVGKMVGDTVSDKGIEGLANMDPALLQQAGKLSGGETFAKGLGRGIGAGGALIAAPIAAHGAAHEAVDKRGAAIQKSAEAESMFLAADQAGRALAKMAAAPGMPPEAVRDPILQRELAYDPRVQQAAMRGGAIGGGIQGAITGMGVGAIPGAALGALGGHVSESQWANRNPIMGRHVVPGLVIGGPGGWAGGLIGADKERQRIAAAEEAAAQGGGGAAAIQEKSAALRKSAWVLGAGLGALRGHKAGQRGQENAGSDPALEGAVRGAAGEWMGGAAGGAAGSLIGGAGGAALGGIGSALSRGRVDPAEAMMMGAGAGSVLGGVAGGIGGSAYGAHRMTRHLLPGQEKTGSFRDAIVRAAENGTLHTHGMEKQALGVGAVGAARRGLRALSRKAPVAAPKVSVGQGSLKGPSRLQSLVRG